jgi:hypothetical protein
MASTCIVLLAAVVAVSGVCTKTTQRDCVAAGILNLRHNVPTAFVDALLLRLSDPGSLLALLMPSGDPAPTLL